MKRLSNVFRRIVAFRSAGLWTALRMAMQTNYYLRHGVVLDVLKAEVIRQVEYVGPYGLLPAPKDEA
jgi:hypothetical protein